MSVTWDTSELDHLAVDLLLAMPRVTASARVATVGSLHNIEATGRSLAPVLTGNLRDSYSTDIDSGGLSGTTGPTADYAEFVEDGTSVMAPQPSLGPAFDRHIPGWERGLDESMDRIL